VIISLGDVQLPGPKQALIYQHLSIRWKAAFRPTKSYANCMRFCSASASTPLFYPKSRSWGITEIGQPANFLG
jgi:hypothetical protein